MIKTMKIAILGFGREGQSLLNFLKRRPEFRGAEIWILDKNRRTKIPGRSRAHPSIRTRLGKRYLSHLHDFDLVFRSPGITYLLPALVRARRRGVPFTSLTALFFEYCPATIIGITGTKGKGTTATLLYKMLKAAHRDAYLAGNVGTPALNVLPKLKKKSLVVLELSSFQLQDLAASPSIAVVLEIFPDHQDAHKNIKEYYDAKANIARFQSPRDKVFFFKHDRMSARMARVGRGKKIAVSDMRFKLFAPEDLVMPGYHNFKNAVMAATVARVLGVPTATIIKMAKTFSGNEHRLEFVRRVRGVAFYNDSASTNPQTTAAAAQAFADHPIVLIAGGKDKGLDYAPLARALNKTHVVRVVLFGENREKIQRAIHTANVGLAPNLRSAVRIAYHTARTVTTKQPLSRKPPIVLFSPGAASFDQFKNYADRGAQFKGIARKLK